MPALAAAAVANVSASPNASPVAAPAPTPSAGPSLPPSLPGPQRFGFQAQVTQVQQYHGAFRSAYAGPQSLYPGADTAKTIAADAYLGLRLARLTELYVNPELDQGFGLGQPRPPGTPSFGTIGAAAFFSAEAYKVGSSTSYGRIQRAFVRHTVGLGGGPLQSIDPGVDQLGTAIPPTSLVLTAGKFAVTDVFDNNVYAHDPSRDFLNWTLIDMGAFDYAADAWGFSYGASAEYTAGQSTFRAGLFQLSAVPNAIPIEHVPLRQASPILEYERRTALFGGRPGAIKALVYADDAYMGAYADAVAAAAGTSNTPSTADVRQRKHVKTGAGLNVAQEVAPHVGVFLRASAMNGTYEAYEFTDVDRSVSTGFSVNGSLYRRPNDTFALGGAFNGLSSPARRYLAAGGLGILVGDGALAYGGERVLETYYRAGITPHAAITLDYQYVTNPAYNSVRGPISVYGLRYHLQR